MLRQRAHAFSIIITIMICAHSLTTYATASSTFSLSHITHRLHQIFYDGSTDLYVTGYAWHNRFTYTPDRLKAYNELAVGGGIGKGFYDEDGDWQGLYGMVFSDSHRTPETIAGYGFLKMKPLSTHTQFGFGYTAFLSTRSDMNNGYPFPGALPLIALTYKKAMITATYIPGRKENGNVLFIFGKYTFDEPRHRS
jgi:palmitoyl transferase